MTHITQEQAVELARDSDLDWHAGYLLDDERDNRYHTLCNAAIDWYIAQQAAPAAQNTHDILMQTSSEYRADEGRRILNAIAQQAAPAAREPLTEKEVSRLWSNAHNDTTDRMAHQVLANLVERHHGIGTQRDGV